MANCNEAIAAVNHWRGQCLDNFARVEKAIIASIQEALGAEQGHAPRLHESAPHRTRNLATPLRQTFPKNPLANKAAARLDRWSLREKQRNDLVHGCFTVKGANGAPWSLVNEVTEIKKGVTVTSKKPMTAIEAQAFLESIILERKELEVALRELKSLSS
jgi:hypothetical protein